jgi:hypothetical protein
MKTATGFCLQKGNGANTTEMIKGTLTPNITEIIKGTLTPNITEIIKGTLTPNITEMINGTITPNITEIIKGTLTPNHPQALIHNTASSAVPHRETIQTYINVRIKTRNGRVT